MARQGQSNNGEGLYYINADTNVGGNHMSGGKIYHLDAGEAEELTREGLAERVDMPSIEKFEAEYKNAVETYRKKYESLQENPLYAENDEAFKYEVDKLKDELDRKTSEYMQKYEEEVRALREELTADTLKLPKLADDKRAEINFAIDSAITSLSLATYDEQKRNAIRLLQKQLEVMSSEQKAAALNRLPELAKAADTQDREIKNALQDLHQIAQEGNVKAQKARKKLEHLDILVSDYRPDTVLRRLKAIHPSFRKERN